MKIKELPKKEEGFSIREVWFCSGLSYLITPSFDTKWTKHNLHFRSLIVDAQTFEVQSSGWPKFFNYGEKPDLYPDPSKYKDWKIQEKVDGSLVICGICNDQFYVRTRGSDTYIHQNNYKDFEQLFTSYPEIELWCWNNKHINLLFEITTPNNIIVVPTDKVEFTLLGGINLHNLEYVDVPNTFGVKSPKVYDFKNLKELLDAVKSWRNEEGIVLSYNNGQNRVKAKSDWYILRHRTKSELNNENKFIDLFVDCDMPNYAQFFKEIEKLTDYETAVGFQGQISKTVEAGKEVKKILQHMEEFVHEIRNLGSRKEQALAIQKSYGTTGRAGMLFNILDGKKIEKDQIVKLFWQVLKL